MQVYQQTKAQYTHFMIKVRLKLISRLQELVSAYKINKFEEPNQTSVFTARC